MHMSARAALSPRSSPSLLVALCLPLLSFPAFAQLSNKRLSRESETKDDIVHDSPAWLKPSRVVPRSRLAHAPRLYISCHAARVLRRGPATFAPRSFSPFFRRRELIKDLKRKTLHYLFRSSPNSVINVSLHTRPLSPGRPPVSTYLPFGVSSILRHSVWIPINNIYV